MMPELSGSGELRLYRATSFPMHWELHATLVQRALIDAVILQHDGRFWILATPDYGCDRLAIYYSSTLKGPYTEHPLGTFAALRNGGRPVPAVLMPAGELGPGPHLFVRFAMVCASGVYGLTVRRAHGGWEGGL